MIFAWQFQSPGPILFEVGNFAIRWYGLLIAIAVLIGVNLSQFLAKRRGVKPELLADYVIWGIIGAIPCARLYYVLFQWRSYADRPQDIIAIWQGGIAIHGAILGGVIAALIFCRLNRLSFWQLGDLIAPALILGQAIGRWGNFFNSEAFGAPTDLPWKLYIPLQNRPLNLVEYEYFHPTFLYESVWNLGVFALLLYLFFWGLRHGDRLKTGTIFLTYWIAYSAGRVWIEGLRTDSLMLGGIRVAQLVSLTGMALGILGLVWLYVLKRRLPDVRSPRELREAEAIPENSET
ncbi:MULTISPECIES: prolipoprotein diacylglyceryl transferase [unclassified Picosynechococcus]|uniref:prolipoprotein diacylglyceryl transferase n=1 Tax=unclassified Picosynechococcus TaxID=3079910 RepID=UPI0007457D17|nr:MULTISPECIES: prolipoprotein diacylglyceryl transferase [unclassified Picosynechococcus]AMA10529.1 prolipoprotein diacylglyceryl transferase [Picosynechococcus sp. PCC 73109]QCS50944.1 prolipoprotein diacylglyceryl transferase [Picosynechococcus sp. PCC 11901]